MFGLYLQGEPATNPGPKHMRSRKLFHLIALMGEEDRDQFSLFLNSPYFNSSKTILLFWEQWQVKIFELESGQHLSDEEFIAGSKLKVSRVNNLCSQLYGLAKRFLAIQGFEAQNQTQDVFFAQAVLKRDAKLQTYHRFIPPLQEELEHAPQSPEISLALFYQKLLLNRARVAARQTGIEWNSEFHQMHQLLKGFWLGKGLELSSAAVNAAYIFRISDSNSEDPFHQGYLQLPGEEKPSLLTQVYRLTLSLQLSKDGSQVFQTLLQLLQKEEQSLAESVRKDIYGHVLNYCIRQINIGNHVFLQHAFELYVHLLKGGELLHEKKLSPQQYKNINALACRLKHLDWAANFLEEYRPLLSDQHQGMAYKYNKAVLHFHQTHYRNAIRLLRTIVQAPNHDLFYGLDARSYLWKAYFELHGTLAPDEIDDMMRLYDSFRLYINRNEKISPLHQVQYRNLVRYFKRFMQLLELDSKAQRLESLQIFFPELKQVQDLANKTWFFQKVEAAILEAKT